MRALGNLAHTAAHVFIVDVACVSCTFKWMTLLSLVLLCRYSATDHTKFDQSLKHCPLGAVCRNCMPINDTADTCWAVKSPILYKVKSWGKIETSHKSEQARITSQNSSVCLLTFSMPDLLPFVTSRVPFSCFEHQYCPTYCYYSEGDCRNVKSLPAISLAYHVWYRRLQ